MVVLVNNSAVTEAKGTVNGMGQSLLAVFRSFTPAVGSIAFAWSENNGKTIIRLTWFINMLKNCSERA